MRFATDTRWTAGLIAFFVIVPDTSRCGLEGERIAPVRDTERDGLGDVERKEDVFLVGARKGGCCGRRKGSCPGFFAIFRSCVARGVELR